MQAYTDGDPLSFCPYYGYVFPGPHHPGKPVPTLDRVLVVEAIEQEYGLNEPLFTQYLSYIGGVLHGDLGISYQDPAVRVTEVIARAWPVTASVGAAALNRFSDPGNRPRDPERRVGTEKRETGDLSRRHDRGGNPRFPRRPSC